MEIKSVVSKDNKLKFEVVGADHVLMNLLIEKLSKDKDVEFSTYSEPHPLLEGFTVTVRGKNPEKSVEAALKAVKAEVRDMKSAFAKAK